ncbi:MAG: NUDIX hydrolase [Gammaproteobacteria bacterium]|nr:NUDIX hydrolase [Gammaproteobacteria bacterium]
MKITDILAILDSHTPADAEEAHHLARTHEFVAQHPQFYAADYPPGHVTASAWILSPAHDRVLLTHHRKLDRWFQLGGHLEGDASLLAGALREGTEESGLTLTPAWNAELFDVDVHLIPDKGAQAAHFHYDVRFAFIADPRQPLIISPESRDLRWVALDQVVHLSTEASLRRMIEKTRQKST